MHNIQYLDYPKNVARKTVNEDAERIAACDGDGYNSRLTFHENIICDSWDEAIKKIESLDNGWYDDHAVLYRDYTKVKLTKAMNDLVARKKALCEQKQKYNTEHSVLNQKAKFIGCKNCGSKLSKEHLRNDFCPLCRKDLRADYILDKLKWYDQKIAECDKKYANLEKKQQDKAEIKWCVKIEYHS